MRRSDIGDLPFRSRLMRGRRGEDDSQKRDDDETEPHAQQPPQPTPFLGSTYVSEAFAAYDAEDAIGCITLVEKCLAGFPTTPHSQSDVSPSASGFRDDGLSPPRYPALPPLMETCALFHEGVRSYLSLRAPNKASELCESWERYLMLHTPGGDATPLPGFSMWCAVRLADVAEVHEQKGEWGSAAARLTEAEAAFAVASKARPLHADPSAQHTLAYSPRDGYRLALRRLMMRLRHATSLFSSSSSSSSPSPSPATTTTLKGHRSLFASHAAPPSTTATASVPTHHAEEVKALRAALVPILARVPPPHVDVEWVDVWVQSRRCEALLVQLEAPPADVLMAQKHILESTLHALKAAWQELSPRLNALQPEKGTCKSATQQTLPIEASPLVAQTLGEATAAAVVAGRHHGARLRQCAHRLLEEWAQLAMNCFAIDVAMAADDAVRQATSTSSLTTRWRTHYGGGWVTAHVLPKSSRDAEGGRVWSSRHIEHALCVAALLLTAADVEYRRSTWQPRRYALQSGFVFDWLTHGCGEGGITLVEEASALVRQVEAALPRAPCVVYRLSHSRQPPNDGAGCDLYKHRVEAALAYLRGGIEARHGRPVDAQVFFESSFQSWADAVLLCGTAHNKSDRSNMSTAPANRPGTAPRSTRVRATTATVSVAASQASPTTSSSSRAGHTSKVRSQPPHIALTMRCDALCKVTPQTPQWHTLQEVVQKGSATSFLRYVIALVRCLVACQRSSLAVQLLHRVEAVVASTVGAVPSPMSESDWATTRILLHLARATVLCQSGSRDQATQLCEDIICETERWTPAAALGSTATATTSVVPVWPLVTGEDMPCHMDLPCVTVEAVRAHALTVWATACVQVQRWASAIELARRAVHVTAQSGCSAAPSRRALQASLALGWLLLDAGHVKEAQRCAERICGVAEGERAQGEWLISTQVMSALFRDADCLHAYAVRLLH